MAQFYPDGMCDINLNRARENSALVTPPMEDMDTEAMRGSMQEILADNLGQYVMCEFLIGTQGMSRKEGLLYAVNRGYVVLYDETAQTFVVCDIFSIKFVTFYMPGQRPGRTGGPASVPMVTVPGVDGVPASNYGLGAGAPVRSGQQGNSGRTLGR